MKTVRLSADMNLKERNKAQYEVISEIEDDEPFKVIEELTPEKFRQNMQSFLDMAQPNDEIRIKVASVTLDHERNLIVIEQIFQPIGEDGDES